MSIFNEDPEPYPTKKINDLNQQIESLHSRIIEYDYYQFSFEKWKALNQKVSELERRAHTQEESIKRILKKISVTEKQT